MTFVTSRAGPPTFIERMRAQKSQLSETSKHAEPNVAWSKVPQYTPAATRGSATPAYSSDHATQYPLAPHLTHGRDWHTVDPALTNTQHAGAGDERMDIDTPAGEQQASTDQWALSKPESTVAKSDQVSTGGVSLIDTDKQNALRSFGSMFHGTAATSTKDIFNFNPKAAEASFTTTATKPDDGGKAGDSASFEQATFTPTAASSPATEDQVTLTNGPTPSPALERLHSKFGDFRMANTAPAAAATAAAVGSLASLTDLSRALADMRQDLTAQYVASLDSIKSIQDRVDTMLTTNSPHLNESKEAKNKDTDIGASTTASIEDKGLDSPDTHGGAALDEETSPNLKASEEGAVAEDLTLRIVLRLPTGTDKKLEVKQSMTVNDLSQLVMTKMSLTSCRLFLQGQKMMLGFSLGENDVEDGDTIVVKE